jgi:hypothetical protein
VVFDAQLGILERGGGLFAIPGEQVEASCASKTACGRVLNANRLMVCCWSSCTPGMPCSLAGAKIWMTERRMGSCAWSRRRNSARAMAAGCATTLHGGKARVFDLCLGFDQRRAQAGVGAFLGGAGQVDDGSAGLLVQEFERLAARFRGSSEKDGARAGEAFGVETADQGRLVANQREFAGLLAEGGNQVQFESGRGGAGDVADFAAEKRLAADERAGHRARLRRRRTMPPMRIAMPLAT